jgi:hypothetical protein
MRPVGDIYLDLEKLYDELVLDHGMQMGDMIYWLHGHLKIHCPDCVEVYTADNSNPELKYGPRPNRKLTKKKLLKLLKTWEDSKLESKCAEEILTLVDKEYK